MFSALAGFASRPQSINRSRENRLGSHRGLAFSHCSYEITWLRAHVNSVTQAMIDRHTATLRRCRGPRHWCKRTITLRGQGKMHACHATFSAVNVEEMLLPRYFPHFFCNYFPFLSSPFFPLSLELSRCLRKGRSIASRSPRDDFAKLHNRCNFFKLNLRNGI